MKESPALQQPARHSRRQIRCGPLNRLRMQLQFHKAQLKEKTVNPISSFVKR